MTRIGIVDYGMGNRRSVQKALERVGAIATISRDHQQLRDVDAIVVPGVGAFPLAMRNLRELALDSLISERVAAGVPLLGICLGMQLLFERSTEIGQTQGLGLLQGYVTALHSSGLRVPHIGWNEVSFERQSALTEQLPREGCPFYHVHSFAAHPKQDVDIVGCSEYGERFATIVEHERVFGVQFHPEKSSTNGLQMLANFVALSGNRATVSVPAAVPLRA